MSTQYQIVYWRDIPAQVKVRQGSRRVSRQLSLRFQEAIDEAAMRGQATDTDDYLAEWRSSEWQTSEEDAEALADALVAQLEAEYTPERLRELKINKGYHPQVE
jgi:hypothetical protein